LILLRSPAVIVEQMPNEKEPTNPLVSFRCPKADADLFEKNAAKKNWRTQDVLRAMVTSFNQLFDDGRQPQWPIHVLDATAAANPESSAMEAFAQSEVRRVCDEILKCLPVHVNSPTLEAFESGRRQRNKREQEQERGAARKGGETPSPARS
jgi:hypothetical protein